MSLFSLFEDCVDGVVDFIAQTPDVIEETGENVVNCLENIVDWITS